MKTTKNWQVEWEKSREMSNDEGKITMGSEMEYVSVQQ